MESNTAPSTQNYCTWRSTKHGQWVVMGLATIVKPDATVKVRRANGEIDKVTIVNVGRKFQLESDGPNGEFYRYGYLTEREDENGSNNDDPSF